MTLDSLSCTKHDNSSGVTQGFVCILCQVTHKNWAACFIMNICEKWSKESMLQEILANFSRASYANTYFYRVCGWMFEDSGTTKWRRNGTGMKFVTRRWNAPSSWENLGECYTTVWYSIRSSEHYFNCFIFLIHLLEMGIWMWVTLF